MKSRFKGPQQGFTLIELVVVIVIIGILAAFAIPRFGSIATDARISSVNGMLGTVRSTSALVHGLALARGITNGSITLEGQNVAIVNGYPSGTAGAGLDNALSNVDGYTITNPVAGTINLAVNGAPTPANCAVTYTEAADASTPPVINSVTTGC